MSLFKTLLLKPHNLLYNSRKPIYRAFTSSPQSQSETQTDQNKKPLVLVFQDAVGLCQKPATDIQTESQSNEVKKKLWELEREVRDLKETESKTDKGNQNVKKIKSEKPNTFYELFTEGKSRKNVEIKRKEQEGPRVFKELSPDMKMFLSHLYDNGYFKDANFLRRGDLDFSCFDGSYSRDFIKFAAVKFGKDHQEIAKWLSGSDLKKIALFGCPTLTRRDVFSAKRLRKYFEIQENTVCDKCVLKHSCKFVNQSVWKSDYKTLNLAVVMRVITLYALEAVEPESLVPDEIKASASRMLKEVLKLSQTTS